MRDIGLMHRGGGWVGAPKHAQKRISIRSGFGLGDNLYLHAVVREFNRRGQDDIDIWTPHPEIFRYLKKRSVQAFIKGKQTHVAHYAGRKQVKGTTQFEDVCLSVGLPKETPLEFTWKITSDGLLDVVRKHSHGKPICLVQLPRMPMARSDNFSVELIPHWPTLQQVLNGLRERGFFMVQVGKGEPLFRFKNIDLDLVQKTSVPELLDLAATCALGFGQVSSILPLCEGFNKPVLAILAQKGLESRNAFIASITPEKVAHGKRSCVVVDSAGAEEILSRYDAALGSPVDT